MTRKSTREQTVTEKGAALQQILNKGSSRSREPKTKSGKGKKQALPSSGSSESDSNSATKELEVHTSKKKLRGKSGRKHAHTRHAMSEREVDEEVHMPRPSDNEVVEVASSHAASELDAASGRSLAESENGADDGSDGEVRLL